MTRYILYKAISLEWVFVIAIAPFLLFPTVRPLLTALALVGLGGWWLLRWIVHKEPWPVTPFNGALLLFSVMLGIGTMVSIDFSLTLPKTTGLILGLAIFRALAFEAGNERGLLWGIIMFLIVGLIILGVGVLGVEWKTILSALEPVTKRIPRLIKGLPELRGEAIHPNQLAGAMAFYIPFVVSMGFLRKLTHHLIQYVFFVLTYLMILFLFSSALILTQSRSSWIGGVLGILIFVMLWIVTLPPSPKKRSMELGIIMLVVTGLIGGFLLGPERLRRVLEDPPLQTPMGPLGTLQFRQELWRWAIVSISDFPFTGCGIGTFREVVRVLYPLDPRRVPWDMDIAHAHNIFLQTALDLGIPGLVAYLALLGIALGVCWRVAVKGDRWERAMALGLAGSLIALHAYGMTDALALGSKPAVAFWFALGIVGGMEKRIRPPNYSDLAPKTPKLKWRK
jgi:putative inorganic carbon (HCO3(-)) transporter